MYEGSMTCGEVWPQGGYAAWYTRVQVCSLCFFSLIRPQITDVESSSGSQACPRCGNLDDNGGWRLELDQIDHPIVTRFVLVYVFRAL